MKAFKSLQTAQEMRHYLETYNSYTTAFHYTSLDSLVKIFTNKTLRFSQISEKNDKIEDVPLSDKILKSLEVYPSPLYTLSELKSAFADKGKNCAITPHFCTSDYAGTVILKE